MLLISYPPVRLVVAERVCPSGVTTTTLAFVTAAPDGSVTVPCRVPALVCAIAAETSSSSVKISETSLRRVAPNSFILAPANSFSLDAAFSSSSGEIELFPGAEYGLAAASAEEELKLQGESIIACVALGEAVRKASTPASIVMALG